MCAGHSFLLMSARLRLGSGGAGGSGPLGGWGIWAAHFAHAPLHGASRCGWLPAIREMSLPSLLSRRACTSLKSHEPRGNLSQLPAVSYPALLVKFDLISATC